jgi:hypothetical protein
VRKIIPWPASSCPPSSGAGVVPPRAGHPAVSLTAWPEAVPPAVVAAPDHDQPAVGAGAGTGRRSPSRPGPSGTTGPTGPGWPGTGRPGRRRPSTGRPPAAGPPPARRRPGTTRGSRRSTAGRRARRRVQRAVEALPLARRHRLRAERDERAGQVVGHSTCVPRQAVGLLKLASM